MVDVDAGVEHRHLHALAVVAGRPGRGRADQWDALLEVDLHPAVEPQLGQPGAERRAAALDWAAGRDGGPEGTGLTLVGGERGTADALQATDLLAAARRRRLGSGSAHRLGVVCRDQRHGAGLRVVVAHLDQVGDVEQPPVQLARAVQRHGLVRHDIQVALDLLQAHAANGVVRPVDVSDLPAVGQRPDRDDIAGDQRDRVGRRRLGGSRGRLRRGLHGCLRHGERRRQQRQCGGRRDQRRRLREEEDVRRNQEGCVGKRMSRV